MSDEEWFDLEIRREARQEYEDGWCALADYYLSGCPTDEREDENV